MLTSQLHKRIPFIRRPFYQRDTALAERDTALAERDTALAERDIAHAERDTALTERNGLAQSPLLSTNFEHRTPTVQNAIDIFRGRWASDLTSTLDVTGTGSVHLFEGDARPQQAAAALGRNGRLVGMKVLELGPLEGGHTYQLEGLGAEEITAVEANVEAYLKCLVVKEILGLQRSRFLLGDILEFLRSVSTRFDLVFCSGVLYHMVDPLALIHAISGVTDRCFVWSHYYDPENHPYEFRPRNHALEGFTATYWSHVYGEKSTGFWGGNKTTAAWMERGALLQAFHHFNFTDVSVIAEDRSFSNGSNLTFASRR